MPYLISFCSRWLRSIEKIRRLLRLAIDARAEFEYEARAKSGWRDCQKRLQLILQPRFIYKWEQLGRRLQKEVERIDETVISATRSTSITSSFAGSGNIEPREIIAYMDLAAS